MTYLNHRVVLHRRPLAAPELDDFRVVAEQVPALRSGEFLIAITNIGISPSARIRMSEKVAYAPPLQLGETITAPTVGRVIESANGRFSVGEVVTSFGGWQEYSIADGTEEGLSTFDTKLGPDSAALGIYGSSGFTAWAGLGSLGDLIPGQTVVVSAASGAVGSMVCQIATIRGCRVVGIAGGSSKVEFVTDALRADRGVDYHSPTFEQDLRAACPDGVDVYFENVGGNVRAAVWDLLNYHARVLVCGLISEYNSPSNEPGPAWLPILAKVLTVKGFLLGDCFNLVDEFRSEVHEWDKAGLLSYREDVRIGIESAPQAFIDMLSGRNRGKTIVRVG